MVVALFNNSSIICFNDFYYLMVKRHLPVTTSSMLLYINYTGMGFEHQFTSKKSDYIVVIYCNYHIFIFHLLFDYSIMDHGLIFII